MEKNEDIPNDHSSVIASEDSVVSPLVLKKTGTIDKYAIECSRCKKWRLIDTQEEYEDIRSNILQRPFDCTKKEGVVCEDPEDIKCDDTKTWFIDRPNLPKPPEGFKRSLVLRRDYSKMDVYYISPLGKKLRSQKEVAAFVKVNPEYKHISLNSFYFKSPKMMPNTLCKKKKKKKTKSFPGPNLRNKKLSEASPSGEGSQIFSNNP